MGNEKNEKSGNPLGKPPISAKEIRWQLRSESLPSVALILIAYGKVTN